MTIINIYNSEKELFLYHPKTKYWKLKDIFKDYWNDFLLFAQKNSLNIRDVVYRDVKRMIDCQSTLLGFSLYKCNTCGNEKIVPHTCKSRFCNSCGIKYSKQRATSIESKLISGTHRHLVFTISDILWPLFLQDRNRLNYMFKAVSETLLSWYSEQYKYLNLKPGFVLTLHTFGRDNKWNVHIHCLLSEFALGNNISKKIDFIPFNMLRKRFQKILMDLLEKDIGKCNFKTIKNKVFSSANNGFYVRAKKSEFSDSKKAVSYVLRYCGRPCFAQYRIIDIDNDFISFWYQRHEDDKFVVEKIHVFEFIARLIRHIPEPQFKTIRYYGFYASKKHKLYDSCRKLIDSIKIPILSSFNKWQLLLMKSFNVNPLKCDICGDILKYERSYIY